MVEADVLCDRIAIQVAGQLHCLGTPAHLKAKYASGYELVVKVDEARSKTQQDDADAAAAVSAFAAERLGATEVSADAGTLTYELPPRPGAELLADGLAAALVIASSPAAETLDIWGGGGVAPSRVRECLDAAARRRVVLGARQRERGVPHLGVHRRVELCDCELTVVVAPLAVGVKVAV